MTGAPLVACVGSAVLDRVYRVAALPGQNGKRLASGRREGGGGIAATAAMAVAALGGRAAWLGPLGDDAEGERLLGWLVAAGVDVTGASVGARSPVAVVFVEESGDYALVMDRDRRLAFELPALMEAGVVLVEPRHPEAALAGLEQARARGVPGVLDGDQEAGPLLPAMVETASHVVFAQLALAQLTGESDPGFGLAAAGRLGGGVMGVTLGEAGSLFLVGGVRQHVPAVRVQVADTTGCGDVFHGAFALGLAEGMGVLGAARLGAGAAAVKAARGQGWERLATRGEAEALLGGGLG